MSRAPPPQTILRHWREAVPDDRLAHLVKDATRALVRALQMRLAEHKVSFGHWTFLRILWEGDGLTQRELSDEAGVMEPTTFAALKAMERLGYIARRQRGDDRKKVYVFLTPKGRAAQARARAARRGGERGRGARRAQGRHRGDARRAARDHRKSRPRGSRAGQAHALDPGTGCGFGTRKAAAKTRRHFKARPVVDLSRFRHYIRRHELAHQRRPAEDPLAAEARGAGEPVDQVPRYRAARVLQGRRGEPVRHPGLELPHAHERGRAPEVDVRRRDLVRHRRAGGAGRSAQVPRRAPLHRPAEGCPHQDRPERRDQARLRQARRPAVSSSACRISTSWAARSAWRRARP